MGHRQEINVSGPVLVTASTVLEGIAYLAAAWTAYVVCAGVGERIAASSRIGRASIDASLIRLAARVVGIAAAITIIFFGATRSVCRSTASLPASASAAWPSALRPGRRSKT